MDSNTPIIKYPFGEATTEGMSASGTQVIEIINGLTVVDGAAIPATGDRDVKLTPSENLDLGARVVVKSKTTATEKTTFSGSAVCVEITGVAGKTNVVELFYDGNKFIQTSPKIQID